MPSNDAIFAASGSRQARALSIGVALVCLWTLPATQAAADARLSTHAGTLSAAIGPQYAYLVFAPGDEPAGGGALLSLEYWFAEQVALQLAGQWTAHGLTKTENRQLAGTFQLGTFGVGLAYRLDLLAIDLQLEAGIQLLFRKIDQQQASDFGVRVGLSLRYWLGPHLGLGLAVHYHGFITDLGGIPAYVNVGPLLTLRLP